MNNWTGIFILGCWIALFVHWIVSAFNVKKNIEKHLVLRYKFFIIAVVAALYFIMAYKKTFLQNNLWQTSVRLGIITDLIVLIGLIFAIWARAILGRNWSASITFKKGHKLIKHGPYSIVRHPIYTGLIIMSIGTAINIGQVYAFVMLVAFIIGFNGKFRQEEELMLKHFSKDYKAYKKRVKALVPFIY